MKHKLPKRLRIELIDNKITNTEDLLMAISQENNYEMLKEYYEFINNYIDPSQYEDIDVILFALNSRVKTLETTKKLKEEMTNIKKINSSLDKISFIEDPKEQNDLKKDMYYLKYVEDDGSLTILEISNNEKLLNLLTTVAPTMNAQSFIYLLKTRYFNELPTYNMGKDKINILTYESSYLIPDRANFNIEKQELQKKYPDIVAEVSIDSNKERLYHIGETIIKFHNNNGLREPIILSKKETKEKKEQTTINYSEQEKQNFKNINIDISLEDIENTYVETEEVIPLLSQYTNGKTLEKIELTKIYAFLSELLTRYEIGNKDTINNYDYDLLTLTMHYLKTKECNQIEQSLLNRYVSFCEEELEIEGKKNDYSKKLINPNSPLLLDDNGVSLTIIIITITLVLGLILATILLVK